MKIAALLLAALFLPHVVTDDDPVATATDLTLSRADLGEWLVGRLGVPHVKNFLVEQLLRREARRRGMFPEEAVVAETWEAERLRVIEMLHHGKEDRYLRDLEGRGYTLETWAARRSDEIISELCVIRLAQADRIITDEALRDRFRAVYGDAGEHTTIDVLFFSAYRNVVAGEARPDIAELKRAARERAEAAAEAWRSGADMDSLRADSDTIQSDFVKDGRVTAYRRDLLGTGVDRAVNSLDRAGEVSLPVEVFDGSYVIRLVERREVSFESVKDELTAMLAAELPSSGERNAVRTALFERDQGEVLLR